MGNLKVLELFAGTRSIGKAFEARGHTVFSVEWDKSFEGINLYKDILELTRDEQNRFSAGAEIGNRVKRGRSKRKRA